MSTHVPIWRRLTLSALTVLLSTLVLSATGPVPSAQASSHREAPLISQDPAADATDVYAFVSPDKPDTVTLIANYYPYEGPAGGPNFYRFADDVVYRINIDNMGDAQTHISYEFRFKTQTANPNTFLYDTGPVSAPMDPNLNVRQTYTLTRVDGSGSHSLGADLVVPPSNVGKASLPSYDAVANATIKTLPSGESVFAGQRSDPFYADVGAIFDLLSVRKLPGNAGGGVNNFAGFNVQTLALQVPITQLTRDGSAPAYTTDAAAVIGVWSTASRRSTSVLRAGMGPMLDGPEVQVSRLGNPLVNEVVIPIGKKDLFNSSQPKDDAQFLSYVTDPELAKLFTALFKVNTPPAPRADLVQIFLTGVPGLTMPPGVTPAEELRLNLAVPPAMTPNRMGVLGGDLAGFPNGRRLGDDIVDISLEAVAGVLVNGFNIAPNNQLGDGVDAPAVPAQKAFPYVATPYSGSDYQSYKP